MIQILINNIFRFVFLVLLQVLVLNNIQFSGLINPYLYVLFILLLPFEIPNWVLLIIGFITGLSIDMFTDTLGLHASATVFLAFVRPIILSIMSPREGYEAGTSPKLSLDNTRWFIEYIIILIFIHHFVLFYLEVLRFTDFFTTLLRVFLSSIFTIILALLSQILMYKKNTNPLMKKNKL